MTNSNETYAVNNIADLKNYIKTQTHQTLNNNQIITLAYFASIFYRRLFYNNLLAPTQFIKGNFIKLQNKVVYKNKTSIQTANNKSLINCSDIKTKNEILVLINKLIPQIIRSDKDLLENRFKIDKNFQKIPNHSIINIDQISFYNNSDKDMIHDE